MTGHGRAQENRSRRRWSVLLLALVAVTGLAAMQADAQSKVPRIQRVSFANSPEREDTFELGERIEVTVRFDRSVRVARVSLSDGDSALKVALTIGARTRHAQFHSITDGRELNFHYTVRPDDSDADGIGVPAGELVLERGTLTDLSDRDSDAALTHAAVPTDAARMVDGNRVTAPRINRLFYMGSRLTVRGGAYRRDHRIEVTVEFDRAVEVTGVPQIALTIGAETRRANFLPDHYFLDPKSTLSFCYTVQPDDRDTDGFSIPPNSLSLNGGAITLAGDAETNAVLIHAAVDAGRFGRVNGKPTIVGAVRETIVRTWKQLSDGVLDLIAPYRTTYSYPSETPCPEAN